MDKTMRVGILVNNFSLLNKITRKIKNSAFNLKHLKNIPNYDHEVDIIVSDKPLENCIIPHTIIDDLDILELKIRSVYYNKKNLTIGIDPGGICGVAVLSKNHVLFCKEFDNINQMSKTIQSIDREIGIEQIKIGIGSPSHRNMIEQAINMFEGKILFVDEQRSGSGSHIEAAIRIGSRFGNEKKPSKYLPKEGEIAWIQKQSRRLSKGLITIDKETANNILIGNLSMEEAIKEYKLKLKI
tara:strand:- start:1304 stop:2026 length:723 start_codon:yes stop_codon:yes gene_type:complete